ncbi:alpha/beta hydrolase fold domain-containing protein [Sediminitomix flava]|nr:alpha/beta hydrolase fold domain-containing protein [Sediminitomix flava]
MRKIFKSLEQIKRSVLTLFAMASVATISYAQESIPSDVDIRNYAASTVSESWENIFKNTPNPAAGPTAPAADNIEGWKQLNAIMSKVAFGREADVKEKYQITVEEQKIGGIRVLEITPKGWKEDGKRLIYTHGGGYTMFSADNTITSAALAANATGMRVISIDYTVAPNAQWKDITGEVVNVFKGLNAQGFTMENIGIFGDSAGGGLVGGSVLRLRDEGLGMPAVVVLWSPWADITETGDTYMTLKHAESNYVYKKVLGPSADAYADPKDQKHPYVSPVYGDFTKGFPPTLIQGGTREIFLSNFIRLYQAIDMAGQNVTLDIYEGMPHVFQIKSTESTETKVAVEKMAKYIQKYIN